MDEVLQMIEIERNLNALYRDYTRLKIVLLSKGIVTKDELNACMSFLKGNPGTKSDIEEIENFKNSGTEIEDA
jgi:hypothetical protein